MKINFFILFSIIAFLSGLLYINLYPINDIEDLALYKNSTILSGEGEVCITPYTEIKCKKGLVCKLTSTTPHINGICAKPNKTFEEDYINRKEAFLKNKTTLTDKEILE